MLRMKVNKKLLQQHITKVTGKIVTLKDLTNIQTTLASQCDGNDLKALVNRLRGMEGDPRICTCMQGFAESLQCCKSLSSGPSLYGRHYLL